VQDFSAVRDDEEVLRSIPALVLTRIESKILKTLFTFEHLFFQTKPFITPKRVTSWRRPSPRYSAKAT